MNLEETQIFNTWQKMYGNSTPNTVSNMNDRERQGWTFLPLIVFIVLGILAEVNRKGNGKKGGGDILAKRTSYSVHRWNYLMHKTYQRMHKAATRANKKSCKVSWNEIEMWKQSFSLLMCKEQCETEIRKVFPFEIVSEVLERWLSGWSSRSLRFKSQHPHSIL